MGKLKIPENATGARTESAPSNGWYVVFDTPDGAVKYRIEGDETWATKLAAKANRRLAKDK